VRGIREIAVALTCGLACAACCELPTDEDLIERFHDNREHFEAVWRMTQEDLAKGESRIFIVGNTLYSGKISAARLDAYVREFESIQGLWIERMSFMDYRGEVKLTFVVSNCGPPHLAWEKGYAFAPTELERTGKHVVVPDLDHWRARNSRGTSPLGVYRPIEDGWYLKVQPR
jgi:hypothetical protein